MPVPDFQSLMLPVLKALSGGAETPISEVRARVAAAEGLKPQEVRELLPSGRQQVFTNRIAWAVTHMSRTGLVEKVRRGVYRLTKEGERLLAQAPPRIDLKVLRNYSAYTECRSGESTTATSNNNEPVLSEDTAVTPEEALERAAGELRAEVEAEVLERVRKAEPAFLEQVAKDLFVAMGYGKGDPAMGQVTGGPGDGGIDVKIKEDALGLDEVYLQVKRYAANNTVGESELRNFAGAIFAAGTTKKGVFVTTASFTKDAKAYVEKTPVRIILIDGKELARLMFEHDIGVRPKIEYKVKRIDEDYFESEDL